VLFHKSFFKKLLALRGDTGARKLLKTESDLVAQVNFPGGETDIETLIDYTELLEFNGGKKND
jgi:molybdenum cofactor cytidylyltransferase